MKTIPLHGAKAAGRFALVDDEDYELLAQFRWNIYERRRPGGGIDGPYARSSKWVDGRVQQTLMHKLLAGFGRTDHIDGDGLNNQRANLREATVAQNNHNQRPQIGSSSRFKGVTWNARCGKWQASIKVNGKARYLGIFVSEEEAAMAYNDAANETYGEYAWMNEVAA